jgi:hypothetical protein
MLPARPLAVLSSVVLTIALAGCAGGSGQVADPVTPDDGVASGEETTIDSADVVGVAQGLTSQNCDITLTVPDGWQADGSMVTLGGDPRAGKVFILTMPANDHNTIEGVASGTMQQTVESSDGWDTNDGGRFLTIGGSDAWLVTGTLTDPTFGQSWAGTFTILTSACEVIGNLEAPTGATDVQQLLVDVVSTITTS